MSANEKVNWEDMIQAYRNSGIGLDKWCKLNNISKHTMSYHLYAKREKLIKKQKMMYLNCWKLILMNVSSNHL